MIDKSRKDRVNVTPKQKHEYARLKVKKQYNLLKNIIKKVKIHIVFRTLKNQPGLLAQEGIKE